MRTFAIGKLPPGARSSDKGDGEIAIYDWGRFLAVTGRTFLGRPIRAVEPELLAEIVKEIEARQDKPKPAPPAACSPEVRSKLDTLLQNAGEGVRSRSPGRSAARRRGATKRIPPGC